MQHRHRRFVVDLLSKVGVPVLSASTVGCLLAREFTWVHGALIALGFALTYLGHWLEFHHEAG